MNSRKCPRLKRSSKGLNHITVNLQNIEVKDKLPKGKWVVTQKVKIRMHKTFQRGLWRTEKNGAVPLKFLNKWFLKLINLYFLKKLMVTCSFKVTGKTKEEDDMESRKQGIYKQETAKGSSEWRWRKPQDKSSLAGLEGDWSRVQTRASHNTHGDILEDEIKNSKNKKMKFIEHLMCLYGKRVYSIRGRLGVKLVRCIENLSKLKKKNNY